MGTANGNAAYLMYPDLGHRAHRVLTYMAIKTFDRPTEVDGVVVPPRWWRASRERIVTGALGLVLPDEPYEGDTSDEAKAARKTRAAHFETVRRCLKELVDAGAITRLRSGGNGRTSEYLLNLDPLARPDSAPVDNSMSEQVTDEPDSDGLHRKGGSTSTEKVGRPARKGGSRPTEKVPPIRRDQEVAGGKAETPSSEPPHLAPVDDRDEDEIAAAAREELLALGPDRYPAYLEAAIAEGIEGTDRQVIRAVELARSTPRPSRAPSGNRASRRRAGRKGRKTGDRR